MKRILIIGNDRIENDSSDYYEKYRDFFLRSAQAGNADVSVNWTLMPDLYIEVGDNDYRVFDTKNNVDVSVYDMIIIRGMGFREQFDVLKTISVFAEKHDIVCINSYSDFRDSSKLGQAVQFYMHNLPVAKTIYVNRAVLEEKHKLAVAFPCVMKDVFGAHGNDNHIVNSIDDIRKIASRSKGRFVLQRFVPNDGDYRILVVGDDILAIGRRAVGDSHLNNTSQGGEARLVSKHELPPTMLSDAIKIANALDMKIAGVDVLIDSVTNEYSFLEVNSQPQLMTGAFLSEKEGVIGSYLAKTLQG